MKPNHSQLRNRAIDCGFFCLYVCLTFFFVMYSNLDISETDYDVHFHVGKFHKFP